jgi:hypothetical protein
MKGPAAFNSATLSAHVIAQRRGPTGLGLGDCSAAGIALAVTVEILAWTNGRDAHPLRGKVATHISSPQIPDTLAGVRRSVCLCAFESEGASISSGMPQLMLWRARCVCI